VDATVSVDEVVEAVTATIRENGWT